MQRTPTANSYDWKQSPIENFDAQVRTIDCVVCIQGIDKQRVAKTSYRSSSYVFALELQLRLCLHWAKS